LVFFVLSLTEVGFVSNVTRIALLQICQVAEYEQMAKDINRSAYTQRILEIVSSIRKQNQDIDKVSCCFCCRYTILIVNDKVNVKL